MPAIASGFLLGKIFMFDANGNPVDASYTGQTYDWNGNATDPGTTVNPYTAAASTPARMDGCM